MGPLLIEVITVLPKNIFLNFPTLWKCYHHAKIITLCNNSCDYFYNLSSERNVFWDYKRNICYFWNSEANTSQPWYFYFQVKKAENALKQAEQEEVEKYLKLSDREKVMMSSFTWWSRLFKIISWFLMFP